VVRIVTPTRPADAAGALDQTLAGLGRGTTLVALSGASNVTGEVWPVAELAAVARRHGARVALDAAQLAAHAPVDMTGLGVDYVAFSGHKLYAPFGAGALVGRRDWLDCAEPALRGGGAVRAVDLDGPVVWLDSPARHEAGTPNLIGAVALAAACRALREYGLERLGAHEQGLAARLQQGLAGRQGITTYRMWDDGAECLGIVTLSVAGLAPSTVAERLAEDFGVSVRSGALCAYPLVDRLLAAGRAAAAPGSAGASCVIGGRGVVRLSFGPTNNEADVDTVLAGLDEVSAAALAAAAG
jgi:selenocysteine lyase/cysteine desulfurase